MMGMARFFDTGLLGAARMTAAVAVLCMVAALRSDALAATGPAIGDQLFKLTAEDASSGDSFGWSVGISGKTAIVGARFDSDAFVVAGSTYLFDVTTGKQLFKLTAADAVRGDRFGTSVAISGSTAIVGAPSPEPNGGGPGSAYLFDVTTGNQLFKLTANDAAAGDNFGYSVGVSGNTAIVGARLDDDAGNRSGSAYLFDVATGQQLFKLTAEDATAEDLFGWSVAISGTMALVGASGDDDDGGRSGSAYLFDVTDPMNPVELAKLTANDAAGGDQFGQSVGISGGTAIVGAWGDDDNGSASGSAYLFNLTDPINPLELAKLTAVDAAALDEFGWSVGISAGMALVGARGDNVGGRRSGAAYLFDVITGEQIAKLIADAEAFDDFGSSVAISADIAIVGAWRDNHGGGDSGSAYLFAVPEPGGVLLLALGAAILAGMRRK